MHQDHFYNAAVMKSLKDYLQQSDWEGMLLFLDNLSNSQFRTACYMLSSDILPVIADKDFWICFEVLYASSPKIWLGSLLKSVAIRYKEGHLSFDNACFKKVCCHIAEGKHKIDEQKIVRCLLPVLETPKEINELFRNLSVDDPHPAADYLIEQNTLPCYFILFQKLRQMDHEPGKINLLCDKL